MKKTGYLLIFVIVFSCAISTNRGITEKNDYDSMVGFLESSKEDSLKYEFYKNEIITHFPSSEKTFELANEEFYEKVYPIWLNDSLKINVISKLIQKYPQTNWRRTMYQYLTYSLNNMSRIEELKEILQEFRLAFPQSARYLNRNDIEPKKALEFARQAHAMSSDYPELDHFPPMEWELEERAVSVNTAALLADILIKQEKYEEAEKIITAVIL